MNTTLFLSVSIDGFIADKQAIPLFPEGAWEDWCALVNAADNVIAGRSSFEQLVDHIVFDLQPVAFGTGVPVFGNDIEVASLKVFLMMSA